MPPPANEPELVQRAQQGDKEAISLLYEAYAQVIYRYISYRVETQVAEDLTADVFMRMVRGLPSYKQTGVPLGAWLFRIAANCITDFYRENEAAILEDLSEHHHDELDLYEQVAQNEEYLHLREALKHLPDDYQAVLLLRFAQDLPHAEVAAMLGKSVESVRVLQHRALKALGTALTKLEQPQGGKG